MCRPCCAPQPPHPNAGLVAASTRRARRPGQVAPCAQHRRLSHSSSNPSSSSGEIHSRSDSSSFRVGRASSNFRSNSSRWRLTAIWIWSWLSLECDARVRRLAFPDAMDSVSSARSPPSGVAGCNGPRLATRRAQRPPAASLTAGPGQAHGSAGLGHSKARRWLGFPSNVLIDRPIEHPARQRRSQCIASRSRIGLSRAQKPSPLPRVPARGDEAASHGRSHPGIRMVRDGCRVASAGVQLARESGQESRDEKADRRH